jgi:hypothetical protein
VCGNGSLYEKNRAALKRTENAVRYICKNGTIPGIEGLFIELRNKYNVLERNSPAIEWPLI